MRRTLLLGWAERRTSHELEDGRSDEVIYRDEAGTEHQVEWVTHEDVELARRMSEIAVEQAIDADPRAFTVIELAQGEHDH